MVKRNATCLLLCLCIITGLLAGCNPRVNASEGTLTFLDSDGNIITSADSMEAVYRSEYAAYLDIALAEAITILARQNGVTPQEGQALLWATDHTIQTAFHTDIYTALSDAAKGYADVHIGCAVTDLKGALIAAYSTTADGENYAVHRTSPHSAFKPLSVYAPAMEKGLIHWSSVYNDSPYKQLTDANGQLQDWPANPSDSYTMEKAPVSRAVAESLNTVAVKCLADLGVMESVKFLQDNFGIPLAQEQQAAESYGEDEIIGNIALGELESGVTPVEMAGYYQIFANGGNYQAPKAVTALLDAQGNTLYRNESASKAVLSPATADTMNKLLQGVVSPTGTGTKANCGDIQVAGKTGTATDNSACWFVGITPEISCAVLMTGDTENRAPEVFARTVKNIYAAKPRFNKNFITHQNLFQVVYCTQSGLAIGDKCTSIGLGYYVSTDALAICNIHE